MLDLDKDELEIIWRALGLYDDSVDPTRVAFRWKILQLRTTIFEELKKEAV